MCMFPCARINDRPNNDDDEFVVHAQVKPEAELRAAVISLWT